MTCRSIRRFAVVAALSALFSLPLGTAGASPLPTPPLPFGQPWCC